MKSKDFNSIESFWEWMERCIRSNFDFLNAEHGFKIAKVESAPTQLSVEYVNEDVIIGLWCEYGTCPAVFVKVGQRRFFTNELRKLTLMRDPLPVNESIFGRRAEMKDFEMVFEYYVEIITNFLKI